MRRIVFLLPDPAGHDPGEVVAGVPRDDFAATVIGPGGPTSPLAQAVVAARTEYVGIAPRYPTDVPRAVVLRFGQPMNAFRLDVLHAVGPAGVRLAYALRLTGFRPPLVVSAADHLEYGPLGWLVRRGLGSADRVIARTQAEVVRYRELGVAPERLALVPFAVSPPSPPPDPIAFRRSLDIPDAARLVLAAWRFDAATALKNAVWAFDVVKYVAPDLHLVLVGDGPERERVERFARSLGFDDFRVRFTGARSDLPSPFALANVVWVTHRRGGVTTALEAMAAGKPVVAVGTPDLAEVVADGITGRLVPPGDRVRLAAVTAELLGDPDRAAALGAAARAFAGRFSVAAMADRYAAVYHDLGKSN